MNGCCNRHAFKGTLINIYIDIYISIFIYFYFFYLSEFCCSDYSMNQYYFSTVEVFFLLWNIIVFIVFGGGEGTAAKVKFSVVTNCISMENVYLLSTKKKIINTRNGSG